MRVSLLVPFLALFACKGKDSEPVDGSCAQPLAVVSKTASSTGSLAHVTFQIPSGTRSFLLTATSRDGGYAYVSDVTDPSGADPVDAATWLSGTRFLSGGIMALGDELVFNWPARASDGPLQPGQWTVGLQALSSSGSPASESSFDVTLQLNRDWDLQTGCLSVRVIQAPSVADDPALTAAVRAAVEGWKDIYAQVGISLEPVFERSELLPDNLDEPARGSATYEALKGDGAEEDLVVVVGETIGGSGTILGEAGSIPGPLSPSTRGVVAVGWLLEAGTDGVLDPGDIDAMGQTMAHEVGHYLGLFHPIELDGYGNPSGYSDALDDTPACSSASSCQASLGQNLMYPYQLCNGTGCEIQDQLTGQQGGVMQRYTGTR